MRTRAVLTTITAALLTASAAVAQSRSPTLFVLDQSGPSVTAIDLASGKVLHTTPLEGSPSILLDTRHGRLLAFDRGTGKDAGDAGFQARTKSSVTILDSETLTPKGRVELGAGLDKQVMLNATGDRAVVLCPGYTGRRPEENLPRELVIVDVGTAQIAGRVPLTRPASAVVATPDGRMAAILAARGKPKQTPELPAELQLVDLVNAKPAASLTFDGDPRDPVLSPDGKYVYLLDRGNPSGNPDKNVNGRLHVISLQARKVDAVHDVGSKPRGLVLDEPGQQLLVVSDATPIKGQSDRPGELRAVRGATIAGPVATLGSPEFIRATSDGKRLFVVSRAGVSAYNARDLSPATELKDRNVNGDDFAISPDGRRAFSIWQQNLYTFDLEAGKQIEKVTTGRMSSRIIAALDAATATQNSKNAARREAERKGQSQYYYTEYSVRDPSQTIAVQPDSKAVYVVNRQTSDVTIVDAQTGGVIEKVGVDGSAVYFVPAAGVALVVADSAVHAVDLTTHKKLDDLASGKEYNFDPASISSNGKYAVLNGGSAVVIVDGSTGKPTARVVPFKRAVDLEIEW